MLLYPEMYLLLATSKSARSFLLFFFIVHSFFLLFLTYSHTAHFEYWLHISQQSFTPPTSVCETPSLFLSVDPVAFFPLKQVGNGGKVGPSVGRREGLRVGGIVGPCDGYSTGPSVGAQDGEIEGGSEGGIEGGKVGRSEGGDEGSWVGSMVGWQKPQVSGHFSRIADCFTSESGLHPMSPTKNPQRTVSVSKQVGAVGSIVGALVGATVGAGVGNPSHV